MNRLSVDGFSTFISPFFVFSMFARFKNCERLKISKIGSCSQAFAFDIFVKWNSSNCKRFVLLWMLYSKLNVISLSRAPFSLEVFCHKLLNNSDENTGNIGKPLSKLKPIISIDIFVIHHTNLSIRSKSICNFIWGPLANFTKISSKLIFH